MSEHPALTKRSKGKIGLILAVIAVLVIGLSAAWYWAAGKLDASLSGVAANLEKDGKVLKCAEQTVAGYPFRIGVFCKNVVFTDPVSGVSVAGGALRSAAQLYRPGHVVAELDSPYDVTLPGLAPLTIDWSNLKTSTNVSSSGLQRVSLVVDGLGVSANDFGDRDLLARMNELQLHARPGEADARSLDVALSADEWLVDDNGAGIVEPIALNFAGNLEEGFAALQAGADLIEQFRQQGGAGRLDDFTVTTRSGGRLSVSGPLSVDRKGRLSGQLTINAEDPEKIVAYVASVFPPAAAALGNTTQYLEAFARREGGKAIIRDFKLTIDKGKVIAGFFEVGKLPRLF